MAANFTVSKRGYEQKEVDSHIEKLEASLNDYQNKEFAISKALINAEEYSRQIVAAAKEQAQTMIKDAQDEINEELRAIEKMIASERKALEDFCSEYDTIVKNYFTGSAYEITAPLREKINLLECIVHEAKERKPLYTDKGGQTAENAETAENTEAGEAAPRQDS